MAEEKRGRTFFQVCDVIERQAKSGTDRLLEKVYDLHCSIRDPGAYDADNVLAETMSRVSWEHSQSNPLMAEELFDMYREAKTSAEKKLFERMFLFFTDTSFQSYLRKCEAKIRGNTDTNIMKEAV